MGLLTSDRVVNRSIGVRLASMYDREGKKIWSSLAILFFVGLAGCGEGAKLLQESDGGGVVVYSFKEGQGPMLSSFRTDALVLIKEKYGGPYSIVREGETQGRTRIISPVPGAEEAVQERRWGIQFQCK